MAINTSTFEGTLQNKLNSTTDAKEMLLLGKAYESVVGGIAVSDIEDAGTVQVNRIDSVSTNTFKTIGGESILGSGNIQAAKVLQTVGMVTTQQGSQSINTTGTQLQNISKTITPINANSSFLISVRWFGEGDDGWNWGFNIKAGSTIVNAPTAGFISMSHMSYHGDNNDSTPEGMGLTTLYKPSSAPAGTPITFSLHARAFTGTWTVWTNRTFSSTQETGSSEIIITEIGA